MFKKLSYSLMLALFAVSGCTGALPPSLPHALLLDQPSHDESWFIGFRQADVTMLDGVPVTGQSELIAPYVSGTGKPHTFWGSANTIGRPLYLLPGRHTVQVINVHCSLVFGVYGWGGGCVSAETTTGTLTFDAVEYLTYELRSAEDDGTLHLWIENAATKEVVADTTVLIAPQPPTEHWKRRR